MEEVGESPLPRAGPEGRSRGEGCEGVSAVALLSPSMLLLRCRSNILCIPSEPYFFAYGGGGGGGRRLVLGLDTSPGRVAAPSEIKGDVLEGSSLVPPGVGLGSLTASLGDDLGRNRGLPTTVVGVVPEEEVPLPPPPPPPPLPPTLGPLLTGLTGAAISSSSSRMTGLSCSLFR